MKHPRILHIASSFAGGAGTAARRVVEAQRSIGLDSRLVALTGGASNLKSFESFLEVGTFQKIQSKILTVLQAQLVQNSDNLMTPLSLSAMPRIMDLIKDFDIINLHATYNVLNADGIRLIARRLPTVVTLHDQRFFTGGCHYSWDCHGYMLDCTNCPQVNRPFRFLPRQALQTADDYLKLLKNIAFVSPSRWLANIALSSRLLNQARISIIPNPIPSNDVSEKDNRGLERLESVLRIGFISKNLNNPYKGLDTLVKAIESIKASRTVQLCLFGSGQVPITSGQFEIVQSEFESDDERVSAIRSCDVVIVPSRQDNYPSVIGECLVLGIPVIASNVGGIREIIDEFELPMFEPGDWQELARLLVAQSVGRLSSTKMENAQFKYSFFECATKYLAKYKLLLDSTQPLP
jgi:glycosyltransferase involved in cell wall biosynthesis